MQDDTRKARIAICEDERIVALDIAGTITRLGYEVVGPFASAADFLESIPSARPDLVLMDIHLQGEMDGVDASARLMADWGIPVIFLTAYADQETIERAKLSQPYGYLLKPFEERELKTAVAIGLYRAQMERLLRQSERRYRSLFEGALSAVFVCAKDGTIAEGNEAFKDMCGNAGVLSDIVVDQDALASLWAEVAQGGQAGPAELTVRTKDGCLATTLVSAAPLVNAEDTMLVQILDITERRKLELQLAKAQKVEAVGRLAGGAAHDFNNILTAVLGYAKLLKDELGPRPELNGIEEAALRAATLARQLLVFSRTDYGKPGVLSLGAVAEGMEKMLRRLVGEDVAIRLRRDGPDSAFADRTRIEQVILNLAVNSRDAMPHGGRISISTGRMNLDQPSEGRLGPMSPGAWSYVKISDDGEGMSADVQARVFEPFFSTKGPEQGTGLGLSTVAGIVAQAGGNILLDSEPGRGTAFTVFLPAADDENQSAEGTVEETDAPGGNELVLLVEDDDSLRALLETVLERAGYSILSVDNPGTALLMVEGSPRRPRGMVADVLMPLMRGPELARRLRALVPELATLYMSGRADEQPPGDLGRDAFIAKPFNERDFLVALRLALDGKD